MNIENKDVLCITEIILLLLADILLLNVVSKVGD